VSVRPVILEFTRLECVYGKGELSKIGILAYYLRMYWTDFHQIFSMGADDLSNTYFANTLKGLFYVTY